MGFGTSNAFAGRGDYRRDGRGMKPGDVYALEAEFPLAGVWDVRLRAEDRQKLYQTTRRIVVP